MKTLEKQKAIFETYETAEQFAADADLVYEILYMMNGRMVNND